MYEGKTSEKTDSDWEEKRLRRLWKMRKLRKFDTQELYRSEQC